MFGYFLDRRLQWWLACLGWILIGVHSLCWSRFFPNLIWSHSIISRAICGFDQDNRQSMTSFSGSLGVGIPLSARPLPALIMGLFGWLSICWCWLRARLSYAQSLVSLCRIGHLIHSPPYPRRPGLIGHHSCLFPHLVGSYWSDQPCWCLGWNG